MMGAPLAVVRARASIANVDCCRNGGITKDRRSGFGCRAVSGKLLSKMRSASLAKKIIRLQRGRRESAADSLLSGSCALSYAYKDSAREGGPYMARQIVMDTTGDTRHEFDPADPAALAEAERRFKELTGAPRPCAEERGVRSSSEVSIPPPKRLCSFLG